MSPTEIEAEMDAAPSVVFHTHTLREQEPDSDGWYWTTNRYAHGNCPHCNAETQFPANSFSNGDGIRCKTCQQLYTVHLRPSLVLPSHNKG